MASTKCPKTSGHASACVALMLVVGFAYSAAATVRETRKLFEIPATRGDSASADLYLQPVNSSAEDLRRAVRSRWPERSVVFLSAEPELSNDIVQQVYFTTSYLLYPTRVLLSPNSSAACRIVAGKHTLTLIDVE
jgi:hypothetical protein